MRLTIIGLFIVTFVSCSNYGQGDKKNTNERVEGNANKVLINALYNLNSLESITYNVDFVNKIMKKQGGGTCYKRGGVLRKELRLVNELKLPSLDYLGVYDKEFMWVEAKDPISGDLKNVQKCSITLHGYGSLDLNLSMNVIPGLHDPSRLLELLWDCYNFQIKSETEIDGVSVIYLEGEINPWFLSKPKNTPISRALNLPRWDWIKTAHIYLEEETLFPKRIVLFETESSNPCLLQEYRDYKTNVKLEDNLFTFQIPENTKVENHFGSKHYKPVLEIPAPPRSFKRFFSNIPDGDLLRIIIDERGLCQLQCKVYDYELDTFKLDIERMSKGIEIQQKKKKKRAQQKIIPDVMLSCSPDAPLDTLCYLAQFCSEPGSSIRKFHFAVRDPKTGEIGVLAYYLPVIEMGDSISPPKVEERWFQVVLDCSENEGGYHVFELTDREDGGHKVLKTLEETKQTVDMIKKKYLDAGLVLKLSEVNTVSYQREREAASKGGGKKKASKESGYTVQDFIDLLTYMKDKGADLKWESF